MQLMSRNALDRGYHVFISNPLAPPNSSGDKQDLELINFTSKHAIKEAIETLREKFGSDVEVYAMGFSLGSNHLLRHLGTHKDCVKKCQIKACMSVSGAFDVLATGIDLQYTAMGLYDYYMLGLIRKHFTAKKYKHQHEVKDHMVESGGHQRKSLFKFDAAVRAPMYGYIGGH